MDNVDYSEKIRNFQAITDNYNEETALNYLTKTNWDETEAVRLYTKESLPNNKIQLDQHNEIYAELSQKLLEPQPEKKTNNICPFNSNSNANINANANPNSNEPQSNCFSSFFSCMCCCCKRRELQPLSNLNTVVSVSSNNTSIFSILPNTINSYQSFIQAIQNKLGIIFLYQDEDIAALQELFQTLTSNQTISDLLKQNCSIYITKSNSNEGVLVTSAIGENMLSPSILFCNNKSTTTVFNKSSVIDRLEGPTTIEVFNNVLLSSIEKRNEKNNNKTSNLSNNNSNNVNFFGDGNGYNNDNGDGNYIDIESISNAEIIEQQKRDLLQLEKEEKRKQDEEQRLEREKKKKIDEENAKLKYKEDRRLSLINKIPPEPKELNESTTAIIFRYPDGEKRKERLFNRTDTIQVLYDFIESLGNEIYTELDVEGFELVQSFPFKAYNNKSRTLLEENLYPNAVIQIKEIS